jgi:hypothetical protein
VAIKVFCSYSHKDRKLKHELEIHLKPLELAGKMNSFWSDDAITAGTDFDAAIKAELETADTVILLLSASYFASSYCWHEARFALERHDSGQMRVIPVLLRAVDWQSTLLSKYSIIPRDLRAVEQCKDRNAVFAEIAREIGRVIDDIPQRAIEEAPPDAAKASLATTSFHCVLQVEPSITRAAGLAELIGDIVLQFRGDPSERRICDIDVFLNTNLTSRIIAGTHLSEATLSLATGFCTTNIPVLGRPSHGVITGANAVRFACVPAGVDLFVSADNLTSTSDYIFATLIEADSRGEGLFVPQVPCAFTQFEGRSVAVCRLVVDDHGNSFATWELGSSSSEKEHNLSLGVVIAYHPEPARNLPALGTMIVRATVSPTSINTIASTTAPVPRFADVSRYLEVARIDP